MGSWSVTCCYSHLPIPTDSDKRIVGIPVYQTHQPLGLIASPCSHWRPVGPPVRGVYDNYGGIIIDDEDKPLLQPLIDMHLNLSASGVFTDEERKSFRRGLRGLEIEDPHKNMYEGETCFFHVKGSDMLPDKVEDRVTRLYWCFIREDVYDALIELESKNVKSLRQEGESFFETVQSEREAFESIDELTAKKDTMDAELYDMLFDAKIRSITDLTRSISNHRFRHILNNFLGSGNSFEQPFSYYLTTIEPTPVVIDRLAELASLIELFQATGRIFQVTTNCLQFPEEDLEMKLMGIRMKAFETFMAEQFQVVIDMDGREAAEEQFSEFLEWKAKHSK